MLPVGNGETARRFKAGEPVPYQLGWRDKNDVMHWLNPGRAFVADPKIMREADTAKRSADFAALKKQRETPPLVRPPLDAIERVFR